MKYKILYITFTDLSNLSSGSSVRPHRMYNAFLNLGHDVKLLEGEQNKRRIRRKKVKEIMSWLDSNKPDLCYVEPPSGPFFNSIDLRLLKKIYKMKIPIALFYRDFYWMFPDWAWKEMPHWKRMILIKMHKRDLRTFKKCCEIVYFPSIESSEFLQDTGFKRIGVLPPGCSPVLFNKKNYPLKSIFYAGGVRYADGVEDLLIALDHINKRGMNVTLNLITHKTELVHIRDQNLLHKEWLNIFETSGKGLIPIYENCDLGVLPKKRHFYMDVAISVKVLECMSHGLPMISTDCPAMARFIKENKSGIICKQGSENIEKAIVEYYTNKELYLTLMNNVKLAALNNTWEMRAEQVISDLMDY